MSDYRGFDAEYPPTTPVPAGYTFAGVYTWGLNAARITLLSEQAALQAANYRLFAYGVGYNACPRCLTGPMTTETGTAHGQAFAAASRDRGLNVCCWDWEAGGSPPTQQLPGFLAYATAGAQAVHDAGCLVGHYGTPEILGALMPAQGGSVVMDFVVLTHWTQSPVDDAVSQWWRQRFPRFVWQYGGDGTLDYLVCSQEFYDAMATTITAGPEQPASSQTFPNGFTVAEGFYAWNVKHGWPLGEPVGPEYAPAQVRGAPVHAQRFQDGVLGWWPGSDPANYDVRPTYTVFSLS